MNTKSAFVLLTNQNQILLLQEGGRLAYGLWAIPGGHVDEGETFEQAAIRECLEESGYHVALEGIVYKSILSASEYKGTSKDTPKVELIIFKARIIDGELTKDSEALDLKWIDKQEALKLPLRWKLLKNFFTLEK